MSSRDEEYRLRYKRAKVNLHARDHLRFYRLIESTWVMVRLVNVCESMVPQQSFYCIKDMSSLHQRRARGTG